MMIKDTTFNNPTIEIPPWNIIDDPTVRNGEDYSVFLNEETAFCSDNFRMFEFKIRKCMRGGSHDWTECPFVHPGEKARRRDPRKFHYSGTPCPEFRKGNCKKGDSCEYGHGVFECWLHPSRYRTQPCKDGPDCPRRICFFAHSPKELRILSPKTPDSVDLHRLPFSPDSTISRFPFSPESTISPLGSPPTLSLVESLRQLHLSKVKSMPCYSPRCDLGRFSIGQPGFFSLPTTPNRTGMHGFDHYEDEPVMERVESGRDLRAKMLEKLSRENFLGQVDQNLQPTGPDVGWVSDLLE